MGMGRIAEASALPLVDPSQTKCISILSSWRRSRPPCTRCPSCSSSACSGAAAQASSLQGTTTRPVPHRTAGSPPSLPSIADVAVAAVVVAVVGAVGAAAAAAVGRCSRTPRRSMRISATSRRSVCSSMCLERATNWCAHGHQPWLAAWQVVSRSHTERPRPRAAAGRDEQGGRDRGRAEQRARPRAHR